jgi:hypothetical protein
MTASTALNETRLPRAVLRQSAAIAERFAARAAESGEASPASATAAPAATPAAAPATTPATQPATAVDPRENDPNYWKQRFNVTSGILAKERKDRQDERSELLRKNTELQTQAASSKTAVPDAAIDLTKFYSPAQIEQYGEEQCRVMAKTAMDAARSTAQDLIDAAVRPLKEQREREVADKAADRKQKFVDKLAELVPDYPVIDVDPRWADEHTGWLAQEDENGVQRQQLLNIHIGNSDAPRVAKMFEQFRKAVMTVATPPIAPNGTGAAPAGDGRPPEGAAGLTAPTDAEVKDFFKRSAIGKVKDDERVSFEARLKLRNAQAA